MVAARVCADFPGRKADGHRQHALLPADCAAVSGKDAQDFLAAYRAQHARSGRGGCPRFGTAIWFLARPVCRHRPRGAHPPMPLS